METITRIETITVMTTTIAMTMTTTHKQVVGLRHGHLVLQPVYEIGSRN